MDLSKLKENWEGFAQSDPMWAILTVPGKEGRQWDTPEFFESGRVEIGKVLQAAQSFGFCYGSGNALDFGCGLGRLTQALCQHFGHCYGVDIAPTMISEAKRLNRHNGRCTYIQNDHPDLRLFQNDFFDFIYSNIVLQHMRPEYSKCYLREFLRVLAPGGLLVFQLASRRCHPVSAASKALGSNAFRARLASSCTRFSARPSQALQVPLVIENTSSENWPALGQADGTYRLFIGNHWYQGEKLLQFDDGRAVLPYDVSSGSRFDVTLSCRAPRSPGNYVLEVDMGQERVTWFKNHGSPTLKLEVRVEGHAEETQIQLPLSQRHPKLYKAASRLHLLPLWRRMKPQIEGARRQSDRPIMEVYGNLPEDICEWIRACGGQVLRVEEDEHAKPDWLGNRYWVRKPGITKPVA